MHAMLNFEPEYLVLKLVFRGLSKNSQITTYKIIKSNL